LIISRLYNVMIIPCSRTSYNHVNLWVIPLYYKYYFGIIYHLLTFFVKEGAAAIKLPIKKINVFNLFIKMHIIFLTFINILPITSRTWKKKKKIKIFWLQASLKELKLNTFTEAISANSSALPYKWMSKKKTKQYFCHGCFILFIPLEWYYFIQLHFEVDYIILLDLYH
jgi:hypothetical protein